MVIHDKTNTNRGLKYLFTAALALIFAFCGSNSVSALDISQESLDIVDKSPTTFVHKPGIGNLSITPNLEFNRLNDFISYKLVLKNNDGKKYQIVSITDDNTNDAIELAYSYPTGMDLSNKEIGFTVKYIKIATSPLKTINVTIKIIDEDNESSDVPIVIPNTGLTTSLDTVSAAAIQSAIIYIVFAAACFIIYIVVRQKKMKKDKKANLKVPKVVLSLVLLLGIIPVAVIAASFESIYFTVNLTEVKLNGPFEVTFDTGEGGTPIPPQIVNKGEKAIEPVDPPQRSGYGFKGWVDENGDPYDFDTPVTGPITIKAKWEIITYDISYDLADDPTDPATVSGNPATYNVETNNITLNNPTRDHYDFAGWTGTGLSEPTMTVTIPKGSIENRSYTATWKKKEYTATFKDGDTVITTQTKEYKELFTEPARPIKTGYDFVGWQLGGAAYDFSTPATKNIELKAEWTLARYSIDYDWDSGTPTANPDTYTMEDSFTLINPTRHGYDFLGWVGSNGNQPETTVTIDKGTVGDLYFDAVWQPTTYTITYEGGGTADPANPTTYNIETSTFKLTNPTKDGAVFKGWTWPGMTTPQMNVEISQGTTGNLTYTANWNEIFTVTYDVNGGSAVSPASFKVESGNAIGTLASTNKDHYDFLGWYLGDEEIKSTYIVRDNITIKAKWKPTEYSINYVLGPDATVDPANPTTYNIETSDFTLNNPVRAGHRFLGWTHGTSGTPEMTVTVTQGTTGELHFNAHWLDLVVVEFDPDGGTYPDPDAYELDPGSVITSLPETTRKGYNFKGWYLGAQKIEPPYKVSDDGGDDITLVAKWELITYDIAYDLADDATDPATVSGNPDTYNVETDTITLNNPTREHYDFTGWTGTDLAGPTMTVTIPKGSINDRSYEATWKEKEYEATFDTDGGTPATIDSQTKKYGETFTAPTTTITKDGYTLDGWLLNGADYDFATPVSADIDLKAKWEPIPYDITYDLADDTTDPATVSGNPDTYTIEDTITLNNPTRDHYDFAGWTGTDLAGPTMTVRIPKGSMEAREYTATWKKKEYTATFKDGDTVITTQTKEYMEQFTEPTKPTKTGYDFDKWQLNNVDYNFSTPVTGDIDLQATWTLTTYHITYDLTGGTPGTPTNPETYTIKDADITLSNPTMADHNFKGWKLSTSDEQDPPQNPMIIRTGTTGDLHFIAHWVGLVTVDFDSEVPGMVFDSKELEKGSALTGLPNPSRDHYIFDGWYHGADKIEEGYIVENDMKLIAKWIPKDYDITYNLDGGSASNPRTYNIETNTFTLNNPTKNGFEFDGWTGTGLSGKTKRVEITKGSTGPREYTANWTELFTVTFDGDGGLPPLITETVRDGETVTQPPNPTKTNYVFDYWKDENNNKFEFSTPIKKNTVLTAVWKYAVSKVEATDTGSDNTLNLKMKKLTVGSGITNGYNSNDLVTKSFKRATDDEYNAIKSTLTDSANLISTSDSLTPAYMWFDSGTGTMYWYTQAEKLEFSGSMGRMFAKFNALTDISSFADFDTSKVTDMNRLLQNNYSLTNIDALENWDVSQVTSFRFAFGGAEASADKKAPQIENFSKISKWNVGNVKDFNQMFKHNQALKNLDAFKTWNFSSATDLGNMFTGTTALEDASAIKDWNVVNVTNFTGVFSSGSGVLPYINTEKLPKFSVKPSTWGWKTNGSFVPNP